LMFTSMAREKDYGKHVHGWGRTEGEARENAYKDWRENYG